LTDFLSKNHLLQVDDISFALWAIAFTIPIAALSYYSVERPILRLKSRFDGGTRKQLRQQLTESVSSSNSPRRSFFRIFAGRHALRRTKN
jgi:peptidoglycan/LPS O-acetylase OafA/YrhL